MTAAAVSPKSPRHLRQLGMSRLGAEINEALLKRGTRAVTRIAPHLTIGLVRLLVRRSQERAVMLLGECLPVQVIRARQSRLARSLATTVLKHDDAAQRLHALWDPDGVVDRIDKLALLGRSLVAHAVIRRVSRREDIIRRRLGVQVGREGDEQERYGPQGSDHEVVLAES